MDRERPVAVEAAEVLGEAGARRVVVSYPGDGAELWLLAYDRPLSAMGLVAGPVALSDNGVRIPKPVEAYAGRATAGAGWTLGEVPEVIAALRVRTAVVDPCVRFLIDDVVLTGSGEDEPSMALVLDDDAVLVGSDAGRFYRVQGLNAAPLTQLATTTPSRAGFRSADGTIWLLGHDHRIARGTLEAGFVDISPRPPEPVQRGDVDGQGDEIFVVTNSQTLYVFRSGRWQRLFEAPKRDDYRVSVAWIGPNEAFVAGLSYEGLHRWKDGQPLQERLIEDLGGRASTVRYLPEVGWVAATLLGRVFLLADDGQWEELQQSPFGLEIAFVLPLRSGIFIVSHDGVVGQYHPGYGYCPIQRVIGGNLQDVAVLADGFLLVSSNRSNRADQALVRLTIRD